MGHISIWNQAAADIRVEFWQGNRLTHYTVLGANDTYDWDLGEDGRVEFINQFSVFSTPQHLGVPLGKDETKGVRVHGWNENIWLDIG